ncbi:hypothetical protein [Janthinobacterium fluminis]|uniref:Transposase DDE domain-containing protein n=1 Tax=Janthinobacterium fluminis TaxID=2987524 RepID=A0ABT5K5D1_9BURK|nr:hypothetical protein [Janthinobacterium fluminis]MDC8759296.1 hypothetical protein [Janthinobacterium fluminis]
MQRPQNKARRDIRMHCHFGLETFRRLTTQGPLRWLGKVRTQTDFTFVAYKLTRMQPFWAGVCLPYRTKSTQRLLKGEEVGKNQPGTGLETSFKVKCGLQRTRGIQVFFNVLFTGKYSISLRQ